MRVHHLDCCTMCPRGRSAVNGEGRLLDRARLVSHCLLLETDAHGLVLVDAGIGVEDVRDVRRLGAFFGRAMGIDATKTGMPALPQIEALGFSRADVRHVVLTHLDFDHAGGLSDFPAAKVHVHAHEREAAMARASFMERERYQPVQLTHGPLWEVYDGAGEPWKAMAAVRGLLGLPPEILALPLAGHSRGHAAIAVDTGSDWLVHAGDAYFHRSVVEQGDATGTPWALRGIERLIAIDYARVRQNHARLAALALQPDVIVFSAHDPVEYERLATRAPSPDDAARPTTRLRRASGVDTSRTAS